MKMTKNNEPKKDDIPVKEHKTHTIKYVWGGIQTESTSCYTTSTLWEAAQSPPGNFMGSNIDAGAGFVQVGFLFSFSSPKAEGAFIMCFFILDVILFPKHTQHPKSAFSHAFSFETASFSPCSSYTRISGTCHCICLECVSCWSL